MIDQQKHQQGLEPGELGELGELGGAHGRAAGVAAFVAGLVVTLAFFAFFPGLPHVIDWGAIVVSVLVGALARWICRSWMGKGSGEGA